MSTRHRPPVEARVYVPAPGEASDVELLPAGDVTEGVVRVGRTTRRPHQPQSLAVAEYLDWLEDAGFDGSPRYLGRDAQGRDVLTFMAGQCAGPVPEPWVQSEDLLASVARLVRRLHAASAGYEPRAHPFPERPSLPGHGLQDQARRTRPPEAGTLVCHLDVTPQNVVVRDDAAVGLIDFDLAGPATALRDSYNAAMHWAPLRDPADAWPGWEDVDPCRRLRIFADAYGWDEEERCRIPGFGIEAAGASYERMRHNAEVLGGGWARMWADGVGGLILRRRDWLDANAGRLVRALSG
ncbi:phosphotransferase [Arthrobacter sp. Hor0625]|uniref:phosphotransferase n=1 Tax=Arthrobacter sp. Hor0625 TaxID=3457358 RepID=UPI00403EABF9